jgi:hypothetical protein
MNVPPSTERQAMRATGTDDTDLMSDGKHAVNYVAPDVAPKNAECQLAPQTIPPVGASNDTTITVDVFNGSL